MPTRLESITRFRLEKLQRLRDLGVDPYPRSYKRTHTCRQAIELFEQQEKGAQTIDDVSLAGRIMSIRKMGKASFVDIRDGSGKIQSYISIQTLGQEKYELFKELDIGDIVGIGGKLFRTHSGEITVQGSSITLLAKAMMPLPEKWHGLVDTETRYRQRYLDLISNPEIKKNFEIRSNFISLLRQEMNARGFIEVETPVLQSQAGGAAARPFVTHHEALGEDLFLRIATELHLKRLIIGGFDKVYEIGRVFRNEGIDIKHNPEFTTMESYEAYADYKDVMVMVEEITSGIVSRIHGSMKIKWGEEMIDFTPPWKRLYLREALRERSGIDVLEMNEDQMREKALELRVDVSAAKGKGKLIDKLLSTYVEPALIQPSFLLDYPVEMSPLAKRKSDDPRLVERFEAFAGGMEIANAFTELNDPIDQNERFREQAELRAKGDVEAEVADEDFLTALEYGMPPTGGLGLGIDRVAMLITGQSSIRDVVLFPQLKSREQT